MIFHESGNVRNVPRGHFYLAGTPKGKLSKLEQSFLEKPWKHVRDEVQVRLLEQERELYILARNTKRMHKENASRIRPEFLLSEIEGRQ
jgi:hypothetical protein